MIYKHSVVHEGAPLLLSFQVVLLKRSTENMFNDKVPKLHFREVSSKDVHLLIHP